MSNVSQHEIGTVESVWRYPVKSMMGEELVVGHVRDFGLAGDRSYAIMDNTDGKIATAKNPRKWPTLFSFSAISLDAVDSSEIVPPVRITLPDGTMVTSQHGDITERLSKALNRDVRLLVMQGGKIGGVGSSLSTPMIAESEEYWPDIEGRDHRDTTTAFTLPTGTFFDAAQIHLLTTATLTQLQVSYPRGRFALQRFRPNIVVEHVGNSEQFPERSWIGHTVAIGHEVRLAIAGPCGRCVMTTLPQKNLPKDPGILRTVLQQNHGNVGVYAGVVQGGTIRQGDRVRLMP